MISVVIPSRNEPYLCKTVDDILLKAKGEIQIIVILDGYWANPIPVDDKRVVIVHRGISRGMRDGINSGVAIAKGEYILKVDAHCMFDDGFDVKLVADCEKNWVVVPRRKRLEPEKWELVIDGRPDIDYEYMCYPYRNGELVGLHGMIWDEKNKNKELKKEPITDLMSAQGSCWFMHKDYFYELELMDEKNYGTFFGEFQEIALKCWLSGGRVIRNKNTWYAHWYKGKHRGYSLKQDVRVERDFVMKWMKMKEAWGKQQLPVEWLIQKFAPVPGWNNIQENEYETSECS